VGGTRGPELLFRSQEVSTAKLASVMNKWILRRMVGPSNDDHGQYANCNPVGIPRTHGLYFAVRLTGPRAKADYKVNPLARIKLRKDVQFPLSIRNRAMIRSNRGM
jgi:hypothetical protein